MGATADRCAEIQIPRICLENSILFNRPIRKILRLERHLESSYYQYIVRKETDNRKSSQGCQAASLNHVEQNKHQEASIQTLLCPARNLREFIVQGRNGVKPKEQL